MGDDIAIKVEHVSKEFKLPHEKQTSIKGALINFTHTGKRNRSYEHQQVLNDISFEVKKGEFFGIVGRNGSGKSTLLKLLAGIYVPTRGSIQVDGKLTPFIELGVGFNPELTGRENVFLNGALLGFNRKEMEAMYDEIVEFAELEKFMDQKLKNYSSGMQVRLAFSIAIRAKSDILVLDEVLAVGDEAFQQKCIRVFDDYKKNKQTVILVTHDMATVKKYCSRAILVNDGEIIDHGSPHEVASKYSQLNQEEADKKIAIQKQSPLDLKIIPRKDKKGSRYHYGEKMSASLEWPKSRKVDTAGIAIYSSIGEYVYATNTALDNIDVSGSNSVVYDVDLDLGAGNYFLMASTFVGEYHKIVDSISDGPSFSVQDLEKTKGEGLTRLRHYWKVQ